MFEQVKGLKIKGKYFTDETEFMFYQNPNDRIALVFGRNGSGKSTLTESFRSCKTNNTTELQSSLIDTNRATVTFPTTEYKDRIFVFDEKYIDENIKLSEEGLGTIVLLGEQVDVDAKLKELEKDREKSETDLISLQNKFDQYSDIKNTVSPLYHLEKIKKVLKQDGGWADRDSHIKGNRQKSSVPDTIALEICKLSISKSLSELESEYHKIDVLIQKTSDTANPLPNQIPQIKWDTSCENAIITLLLKAIEKPVPTQREQLILDVVQQGLQLQVEQAKETFQRSETEYCPYCFRSIDEEYKNSIVNSINKILNKVVDEHKAELRSIQLPIISFDAARYSFLDEKLSESIRIEIEKCTGLIEQYKSLIKQKMENIYTPIQTPNLKLCEVITRLNDNLKKLEQVRIDFIDAKKRRQNLVLQLVEINKQIAHKQISEDNKTYIKQTKATESCCIAIKKEKENNQKILDDISALKQKEKDVQIAIKNINYALQFVFYAKDRLSIELKNKLYYLKSNGQYVKPKDVSCGERNIIALCYFFTQIMSNSKVKEMYKQELFLVVDDPISSFDFENKIGIISYLNSQIKQIILGNQYSKVLILTHDLSAVYDLQKAFDNIAERTKGIANYKTNAIYLELYDKKLSKFSIKKRNEYSELLKYIFKYAVDPDINSSLEIGNFLRRVLEAYSTFTYKDGITVFSDDNDILSLLKEKSSYFECLMYRLVLNGESHYEEQLRSLYGETNFFNFLSDVEKKKTAKDVLCLIYLLNPRHILKHLEGIEDAEKTIQGWCDNIPNNVDLSTEQRNYNTISVPAKRVIKLYDLPISAGTGSLIDYSNQNYVEFETDVSACDYALRISGDSMEPKIKNGDIILIQETDTLEDGEIGAFFYEGQVYCKQLCHYGTNTVLHSLNSHYPEIIVNPDMPFNIYGKVVDTIRTKSLTKIEEYEK